MNAAETAFDELLKAARGGDSRAFEQLYLRLNQRIHVFARVRGATDPEGTVNEVFLSVFTRLGSFTGGETQFTAWVFTIARNKLIDENRKRQRRIDEVSTHNDAVARLIHLQPVPTGVEDEVVDRITTAGLAQKLRRLTDDQRDAVLLRVITDLSVNDIALTMNRDPGAVRSLLARAFRTISRTDLMMAEPR